MTLAMVAHHWKYCFREQRSSVTFAYNCAHIVPRNLVNRVVGAHFLFIVLKQRNHELKLPLARPHCPAMADRRRPAEPAGVVPNTADRWQAQKWSAPSRYDPFIPYRYLHYPFIPYRTLPTLHTTLHYILHYTSIFHA